MTTNLARLITAEMTDQNLSQGDVERMGGPKKQALSYLLTKWTGARNVDPGTLEQLATALRISRRSLGRAAAVDMGLLPADDAGADGLALLTDALRERADEDDREVVVAAARAVWRVLEARARAVDEDAFETARSLAVLAEQEGERPQVAATTGAKRPTRRLR